MTTTGDASGWKLLAYRPVHWWLYRPLEELTQRQRQNLRKDVRACEAAGILLQPRVTLSEAEAETVAGLYRSLYCAKHSTLNPDYTARFFRDAVASGFMQVRVASLGERLVGFVTTSEQDGLLIVRYVGYDGTLDRGRHPVYRGLISTEILEAAHRGMDLFLSTGVSEFKMNRGSVESMEYLAVHDAHLPYLRRLPWSIARSAFNRAASTMDTRKL